MDVAQLEREGKEGVRVQLSYEAKKKGHQLRCLLLGRIFFLKFVCYEVIVKQQIYRRSSNHYCEDLGLGFCLCGIYNVYTHACVYICVMYMLRAQGLGVRVGFTYACVRVCIDVCMLICIYAGSGKICIPTVCLYVCRYAYRYMYMYMWVCMHMYSYSLFAQDEQYLNLLKH